MLGHKRRQMIQRLGRWGMGAAIAAAAVQLAVAADRPASSGRDGGHAASGIAEFTHDLGQLSLKAGTGAPTDDLSAFRDALIKGQFLEQMRELELLEQLREAEAALRDPYQGDEGSPVDDFYGRARDDAGSGPRDPAGSPADGVFGKEHGLLFGRPERGDRHPGTIMAGLRSGGAGGRGSFNPYEMVSSGYKDTGWRRGPDYGDGRTTFFRTVGTDDDYVSYSITREHGRTRILQRDRVRPDGSRETLIITKDEHGNVLLVTWEREDAEGTDRTQDRPGEESTYEHEEHEEVEKDDDDDDSSNDYPAPDEASGEPADAREQRQRTRRLILSGDAFGQPKPDGSGTPSNSDGWWGLVFGLRPPGYDPSPGMGPPDETTQPVQDGAQAAVIRRNLWAMFPWFVNPNPVEDTANAASGDPDPQAADSGHAATTADEGNNASGDDPFAGFSLDGLADLGSTGQGAGTGFVLIAPGGPSGAVRGGSGPGSPPLPGFSANVAAGMSHQALAPGLNGALFVGPNGQLGGMAAGPKLAK